MPKYPLVSIIIVNFNQLQYSIDCLKSLRKISYPRYEIIFVDNGSNKKPGNTIKDLFPKVKIIQLSRNTGFVGGNNTGYKISKGNYILLLNNDTTVTKDFLQPLIYRLQNDDKLGILQSKILIMDKPKYLDNVVSYLTFTGFLNHEGYMQKDSSKYTKFRYTFSTKGACMLISQKVLKRGLFDPKYFAYFEETDLCWRTWLMGFKCAYEPKSVIYHKMGVTSMKMPSEFIQFHSFKNRIRTIIKNTSLLTLVYMLPAHLVAGLGLSIYFAASSKLSVSSAIIKAIIWNISNLNETLDLRQKVQKERRISDTELFKYVYKNPPLNFYMRHLTLFKSQFK